MAATVDSSQVVRVAIDARELNQARARAASAGLKLPAYLAQLVRRDLARAERARK